MSTAIAKNKRKEGFLRPLRSFDDLLRGRLFIMWNGQLLYKNGKGYVLTDISSDQEYTKEDYMQLPEGAPFQLIQGKLIHMPSPKDRHQEISIVLSVLIYQFVKEHNLGIVRTAPLDVHLDIKNIFQPDILFISNERSAILQDWIFGAPDLVVEILSKGTAKIDLNQKKEEYGKHNVLEYWIIDPVKETLDVYENKEGKMEKTASLKKADTLKSSVLKGFELNLKELF